MINRGGGRRSGQVACRMTIELSEDEFQLLSLALAYAASVANTRGNRDMSARIVWLTNKVHEGRPGWTPYEIPPGGPYQ